MEPIAFIVTSIISMCIFYYIIKAAVRNGIKESIEDMNVEFKKAMKNTLAEHEWEKDNK